MRRGLDGENSDAEPIYSGDDEADHNDANDFREVLDRLLAIVQESLPEHLHAPCRRRFRRVLTLARQQWELAAHNDVALAADQARGRLRAGGADGNRLGGLDDIQLRTLIAYIQFGLPRMDLEHEPAAAGQDAAMGLRQDPFIHVSHDFEDLPPGSLRSIQDFFHPAFNQPDEGLQVDDARLRRALQAYTERKVNGRYPDLARWRWSLGKVIEDHIDEARLSVVDRLTELSPRYLASMERLRSIVVNARYNNGGAILGMVKLFIQHAEALCRAEYVKLQTTALQTRLIEEGRGAVRAAVVSAANAHQAGHLPQCRP
jgi:hypothetical protein